MMRQGFIVVWLLSLFNLAVAQDIHYGSIRVKVLDADTDQPLPYTNVFINQTTIGGYTDANGEIEVRRIPFGTHQLIVSEISHKLQQRKLTITSDRPVYITVNLLVKMLDEVQVTAKRDKKWYRELRRFEKLFFGSDHFKQCKITNPWTLQFTNENHRFTAASNVPLKIENNFLGYDLEFNIKTCFFTATNFGIKGDVKFEEKKGDEEQMKKWKKNRENMYRGSPQHFFRAVIDSTLRENGYKVYKDVSNNPKIVRGSTLASNIGYSIIPDTISRNVKPVGAGLYSIAMPKRLEIHYLPKRTKPVAYIDIIHPITWMEVKTGQLIVSSAGIVQTRDDLIVSGMMSDLKVADWLPLNYNESEQPQQQPVEQKVVKRQILLEKPYVQTDRDYYYNGETIWLKGYMSYSVPLLKDTLSQSIYIELSDSKGSIVASKRYPVQGGKFHGDILLRKDLVPGLYQLKAYTAWMLNFDKRSIFTKTIDLLGEKEAVRMLADYEPSKDTATNVWMRTDKTQYSAREKIVVTIDVLDSLDFPTASDLSISVTDLAQAVPHKNEKSILTNYLYGEASASDTTSNVKYNIEYGIDFDGTFWLGKKRAQASITVFQENFKETFGIITDENGRFEQTLSFNDTVNFYLRALTTNNKKGIVVMDTLRPECPQLDLDPLSLDIYTSNSRHNRAFSLTGATLLQEVAITAKRIESQSRPANVIHGDADYTITGDWINDHNFIDIGIALAARIPGAKYNFDPINPQLSMSMIGVPQSTEGTPPLFVIDGVASDFRQAMGIPLRSIDRVEILKYGSTAAYGARGAAGVIAIYTKTWTPREPGDKTFDKSKLQEVKWVGYSTASTFEAPDYSKLRENDYIDYRPTIFWSPMVVTDDKGPVSLSFYAGDIATKYRIVVEGVTAAGVPVRAEKIIEVVKGR